MAAISPVMSSWLAFMALSSRSSPRTLNTTLPPEMWISCAVGQDALVVLHPQLPAAGELQPGQTGYHVAGQVQHLSRLFQQSFPFSVALHGLDLPCVYAYAGRLSHLTGKGAGQRPAPFGRTFMKLR